MAEIWLSNGGDWHQVVRWVLVLGCRAYSLDALLTPGADWRQVALEASLAVELFLLFHEADVSQRAPAVIHGAHEVLRTPGHAQGGHELAPVTTEVGQHAVLEHSALGYLRLGWVKL